MELNIFFSYSNDILLVFFCYSIYFLVFIFFYSIHSLVIGKSFPDSRFEKLQYPEMVEYTFQRQTFWGTSTKQLKIKNQIQFLLFSPYGLLENGVNTHKLTIQESKNNFIELFWHNERDSIFRLYFGLYSRFHVICN